MKLKCTQKMPKNIPNFTKDGILQIQAWINSRQKTKLIYTKSHNSSTSESKGQSKNLESIQKETML